MFYINCFSLFSYNITQAENELRLAQAEFDKQTEITRLMMEGLSAIQTNHLRLLKGYIESQTKFYANCHQIMQDLNRYVHTMRTMSYNTEKSPFWQDNTINIFGKKFEWRVPH